MNRRLFATGLAALALPVASVKAQDKPAAQWLKVELGDPQGLPYERHVFYHIDLLQVETWSEEDLSIRMRSGRDFWITIESMKEFVREFTKLHDIGSNKTARR